MGGLHCVLQGGAVQINLDHAASSFHCLLDRSRHFTRLATAEANTALTITTTVNAVKVKIRPPLTVLATG
jgi:hypothetical protein